MSLMQTGLRGARENLSVAGGWAGSFAGKPRHAVFVTPTARLELWAAHLVSQNITIDRVRRGDHFEMSFPPEVSEVGRNFRRFVVDKSCVKLLVVSCVESLKCVSHVKKSTKWQKLHITE